MVQKVEITHNDTGLGQLYLSDVGRRNSLGGGVSIYEHGQDTYLNPGDTIELVATSQVLLSIDRGVLKTFSSGDFAGELTITFL
ncbi:hypothetical protein N9948_01530 [bacterium]|nr:hypothetical protein [bacterium]